MDRKKRVAFVCSRNAARSQMAEGFLRAWYGDSFEAASAGLEAFRVSRTAIRVMGEAGIDIAFHRSKSVAELGGRRYDLAVTLCDEAACVPRAALPAAGQYLHRTFPDPSVFPGGEEQVLDAYRNVRDMIGAWIREEFGPAGQGRGDTRTGAPPPPDLQKT
ncbi:MAG TPA: arsenate reductase ArsC [Methanomicrobiales archaeon]|nr:arsenate reductase ArsC [Methanomicrobiales archaeon]